MRALVSLLAKCHSARRSESASLSSQVDLWSCVDSYVGIRIQWSLYSYTSPPTTFSSINLRSDNFYDQARQGGRNLIKSRFLPGEKALETNDIRMIAVNKWIWSKYFVVSKKKSFMTNLLGPNDDNDDEVKAEKEISKQYQTNESKDQEDTIANNSFKRSAKC